MTSRLHAPSAAGRFMRSNCSFAAIAVALALGVAGCGNKDAEKPASQTAAKVNKEEITVHQINFLLQQQRALSPDQAASAGKQVLERLIDQELALQKAQEQKLDRDPRVVQQLEAARREIVARAYVERIASGAAKPGGAEVKAYYDDHPALFKDRRVYSLQEIAIQAQPDQVAALQSKLASSKDIAEFVSYLKAADFKFGTNQVVRAAEQLPLASLDKFAKLKDGQSIFSASPTGAQVVILVGSRGQPVDEARATPAIEQFLLNDRKRKVVEDDLKALRSSAKIEYVGEYAKGGPVETKPTSASASGAVPTPVGSTSQAASMPSAAPQLEVEPMNAPSASAPSLGALEKGIKGLK